MKKGRKQNRTADARKGEGTRLRLLDAGIEAFAQFGPEEVGIRRLAAAAGVNSAALSYYFGGKDGYYRAVLRHLTEGMGGNIRESALAARGDPAEPLSPEAAREALRAFLRHFVMTVLTEPRAEAVAAIVWRELLRPSDGFEIIYTRIIRPVHEIITELAAAVLQTTPRDPRVIVLAHSLWGQPAIFRIGFHVLRRRLRHRGRRLSKAVIEMIADTVDTVALRLLPGGTEEQERASPRRCRNGRPKTIEGKGRVS